MEITRHERVVLGTLGLLALAGCALLLWQRQSLDSLSLARDAVPSGVEGRRRPPILIEGTVPAAQAAAWDARLSAARRVDVNTADAAELERLPGVGPQLARLIVAEREARGRFRSAAELSRVPGIGPKTAARLGEYVATE
jgi:competence ComEA-like helix-hairpin-helix protein